MKNASNYLFMPDREPQPGTICLFQLKNGLKVNYMRSGNAPVAAVNIWYNVGSRDEARGKSGFAHLFEHMMFQGSANVPKNMHMQLINDVGGSFNGSTSKDRTNYFQIVPANQLKLALWLEADRMRSLAITPENFENQRSTVKEERRQSIDNAPYMLALYEQLDELVYRNWAYQHSIIGSMADLAAASIEDVKDFHGRYYRPNNAVLSVVGDVDMQEMLDIVESFFAGIPAGPKIPVVDLQEPDQTEERRRKVSDPFAPLPAYICAYKSPPRTHAEHYSLEMIEKILFDGESSRLHQRLVEQEQSVLHLSSYLAAMKGPGKLLIFGQIRPGTEMQAVESAIEEELQRLQQELVPDKELEKVVNQFRADYHAGMARVQNRADSLSFYTTYFDDPGRLSTDLDNYLAVTAEQIRAAARNYLSVSQRTVIELYPRENLTNGSV